MAMALPSAQEARDVPEAHRDDEEHEDDEAGGVDDPLHALVHAPARDELVPEEEEPAAVEPREGQEVQHREPDRDGPDELQEPLGPRPRSAHQLLGDADGAGEL